MHNDKSESLEIVTGKIDYLFAQMQSITKYDCSQFLQQGGIAVAQTMIDQVLHVISSAAQLTSLSSLSDSEKKVYTDGMMRLQEAVRSAYEYLSNCQEQIKKEIASTRAAMKWSATLRDINP